MRYQPQGNFSSANTGNLDLMNLIGSIYPHLFIRREAQEQSHSQGTERTHTYTHNRAFVASTILCHDIIQELLNHLDLDIPWISCSLLYWWLHVNEDRWTRTSTYSKGFDKTMCCRGFRDSFQGQKSIISVVCVMQRNPPTNWKTYCWLSRFFHI